MLAGNITKPFNHYSVIIISGTMNSQVLECSFIHAETCTYDRLP